MGQHAPSLLPLCPLGHCPAGPRAPQGEQGDPGLATHPPTTQGSPTLGRAARHRLINQFVSRTVCFVRLTIARCKWQPLASSSERLLIKIWKGFFCVLKKKQLDFSTLPFQALIYSRLPTVCDPHDKPFVQQSGPIRRPRDAVGESHMPAVTVSSLGHLVPRMDRGTPGATLRDSRAIRVRGTSQALGLARNSGPPSALGEEQKDPRGDPGGCSWTSGSSVPIPCRGR